MQSRRSLALLFSIVILDLVGFGIVVPVLPFYVVEFGADGFTLGMLVAAYAAMQFVFAPLWGRLSDRIGRRPVMLGTIAGTSVALLLVGVAPSLAWLFVGRLLGGVFAANISVASAYITDVTDEADRTRWMGMLGACFAIGFVLGPAIGGLLAEYGYGFPMQVAAAMAAVNFVYAFFVLEEPERQRRDREGPSRRAVLADPRIRRICLANLFFSLAVTQLETVFALLMLHRFDYDVRNVAFLLVGMAVVMGAIQGGGMRALASRYGERRLLLAGVALMAAAFVAIPLSHAVPILLVPLVVSAIGRGIGQPSMLSIASSYSTPTTRGAVMGTFASCASLARVLGPLVAGYLFDLWDAVPFFLAAVLLLVVLALCVRVPERIGDPVESAVS